MNINKKKKRLLLENIKKEFFLTVVLYEKWKIFITGFLLNIPLIRI